MSDPLSPTEIAVLSGGPANVLEGSWPDRHILNVGRLELHSFRLDESRAASLVYVGGGYLKMVHDKEGVEIAAWLNSLGIDAHVVVHRLPGAPANDGAVNPFDVALRDGLVCLDHVAGMTPELPLFHVGLSSGGHLAGAMACQPHAMKLAGALIGYAPINANHRDHKAPAGKPDYPPVEKQAFYDAWPIGIAGEPHGMPPCPVFLAYALHDKAVPIEHALNFIRSARDLGRDVDAHIFGTAPHGFALRDLNGTQDAWPELAKRWFDRQLEN
ncbi:alpha/beta hydrolase [Consotaella aegiceratis]|uniref:alpha/beta hydrolase n=1 Tax=Consotaella aegiceratis TaxID=3097961 RepID=UPI002F3EB689